MRAILCLVLATAMSCASGGEAPNPVSGLAREVDTDRLVLRTDDGSDLTFRIEDSSVTVGHLEEHRIQRLPLKVTWERRDGTLVATSIEDG